MVHNKYLPDEAYKDLFYYVYLSDTTEGFKIVKMVLELMHQCDSVLS